MLFNSFQFLLFFIITTPLYYVVPGRWRWMFLLFISCLFYSAFIPAYLLILFAIIAIDYTAGRLIEVFSGWKRKIFLVTSIVANLGVLCYFKYHDFFVENFNSLLLTWGIHFSPFRLWRIALPLGLSFHTFQAMSYTIEVYRGRQAAERHLGIYALFVMFYPQLVAGPIERPGHLLPQLHEPRRLDFEKIGAGLKTMLIGFFMKVVVADRLGIYVDYVYAHPDLHGRISLLIAVIFYSFQIYCDFAGYSTIAIGAAETLGFSLAENFRQPYLSRSLAEFWRRWHISLSSWFRDYLYIPLGGSRKGKWQYFINILVVFLLSGLWHGANWTFVVWGVSHGMLVAVESTLENIPGFRHRPAIIGRILTFSIVSGLFILFRSPTLATAGQIISRLLSAGTPWVIGNELQERALLLYSLFGIACVLSMDIQRSFVNRKPVFLDHKRMGIRLVSCISLITIILLLGVFDGGQFIYFQF